MSKSLDPDQARHFVGPVLGPDCLQKLSVVFPAFLSSADFFQNQLFRKILLGIPSESNSLDPDQARHFVGPDLGPNCMQKTLVGKALIIISDDALCLCIPETP